MTHEEDLKNILGATPIDEYTDLSVSGRQPTTRLDINTVITRMKSLNQIYDKNGFPLVYISGIIYSFSRFTVTRTGNLVEIKYYQ